MCLKAMAILIGTKIVFMFGFTLYTSGMMFFMQYALNLDIQVTSTVYMVSIISASFYACYKSLGGTRGKKSLISGAMTISGVSGMILWIIGVDAYSISLMYVILFTFGRAAFWQISSAMFYDVAEVDEYVNGKRRGRSHHRVSVHCRHSQRRPWSSGHRYFAEVGRFQRSPSHAVCRNDSNA